MTYFKNNTTVSKIFEVRFCKQSELMALKWLARLGVEREELSARRFELLSFRDH